MSKLPQTNRAHIRVVGLGPGDASLLPPLAVAALEDATLLVGYSLYIDLIPPALRENKRHIATGMMAELERCNAALDAALSGERVAVVCSGDPGVYAMAGLILELLQTRGLTLADLPVDIIPGIPAVCAAAALLGAPLMHDFACVSLSDLLTPWALIEKRLTHALAADFILALYNPRSKRRQDHLPRALNLALQHRAPSAYIGHVQNAYRPTQQVHISTLADFDPATADMLSILILGTNETALLPAPGPSPLSWPAGARLHTPRGYLAKYT